MRIVVAALSLMLSIVAAHAAHYSRVAATGMSISVYRAYVTNPDCSSAGQPVVRISQPPQHGRLTVKSAQVFPSFPSSNVRSACNRKRVPGVQVHYVSQRGYVGSDTAAIDVFFPSGQAHQASFHISVR